MRERSSSTHVLVALVLACLLALVAPALANEHELVFANAKTQLHVRPGEATPIVGHAEEGEQLEVLGDQGRWLRVRAGKQVGWLTRTEVSPTKPAEPRTRVQKSGFSGKPVSDALKVTIAVDRVRGFDDPRTKANNVLDLERGEVVTVIGRGHEGWVLVEHDSGKVGWIPASVISDAGRFANGPREAPAEIEMPGDPPPAATTSRTAEPRPAQRRLSAGVMAAAGAQTFKMEQSGEGDASATASGPLATIAARGQFRVRGAIWAGVTTAAELGTGDLIYTAGTETSQPMATRKLAVDAYAELGWGGRRYIALRGGVHYATLSIDSEREEPMLVGERIAGAVVGLGGALPIYRRLMFSAAVDVMPAGAQQMSRLPAGTLYASTVREAWARAALSMPLPASLMAAVSYRFGALSADLTDGAAMPKTASRTDQSHVVTAGVGMSW